jgi:hypothetical protein
MLRLYVQPSLASMTQGVGSNFFGFTGAQRLAILRRSEDFDPTTSPLILAARRKNEPVFVRYLSLHRFADEVKRREYRR